MLSLVLGLFLVVTAGLKIHGLYVDPYSQESILLTPRLVVALIEIEIVIGVWLLTGLAPCAAWLAALVFFALGAATNLYLALEGQRSCGCFGTVEVNPWWTFGLDGAAVVALIILRPRRSDTGTFLESISYPLKTALGAGALLALLGGALLLLNDDPSGVLARLRGEIVEVVPPITDVGEGLAGEQRTFWIEVKNHTKLPVTIVGGTRTCACIATNDLPLTIAPGQSEYLRVQIRFWGSPGRFQHLFCLYIDADGQRAVVARFAGRLRNTTELED